MKTKESPIIETPKEYLGGKIKIPKPAKPVSESFCWRPDFEGENMRIVMWFRKMLPRNHRGRYLAPGTSFDAKTITPEAADLFRTHKDFWTQQYKLSKMIPDWEDTFSQMQGGILAVESSPESVISTLQRIDKNLNWSPALIANSQGRYSLFGNLNSFFPFAQDISKELDCTTIHLVYEDASGFFACGVYQKGINVEKLEFLSEVIFESEISDIPVNLTEKNSSSVKTFFKVLNLRLRDLNLLPPGYEGPVYNPNPDTAAVTSDKKPAAKKKLSPLQQLRSLDRVTDEHVTLINKVIRNVDFCYQSTRLQSLTPAAAKEFASHNCILILCLNELSDDVARELARNETIVDLRGNFSVSATAAGFLAASKGTSLYLDGITSLSDDAAQQLAAYKGELTLAGLTSISDAAAQALAAHKGGLNLSGLESISDAAAQALAAHKGGLNLSGIKSFSDAAAKALPAHAKRWRGETEPEET